MRSDSSSIGSFRVSVYHRNSTDVVREFEGVGAEWQLRSTLSIPTDDESFAVRIDTVWADLLQGDEDRIEREVEGLCTIVKFGDTMQLRKPFRVVIEINRNTVGAC
jgi:hypothetical protein